MSDTRPTSPPSRSRSHPLPQGSFNKLGTNSVSSCCLNRQKASGKSFLAVGEASASASSLHGTVNDIPHQHMFATYVDVRLIASRSQLGLVHASAQPSDNSTSSFTACPSETGLTGNFCLQGSGFMTAVHRVQQGKDVQSYARHLQSPVTASLLCL